MGFIILALSIWMAADANSLGYDRRDVRGLAAMSPAGWFFAGIFLFVIAAPLYLIKRGELKAAGQRRKAMLAGGTMGALPPAGVMPGYQQVPQPGYPPPAGYGAAPGYAHPPAAAPGGYPPPAYGQPPAAPPPAGYGAYGAAPHGAPPTAHAPYGAPPAGGAPAYAQAQYGNPGHPPHSQGYPAAPPAPTGPHGAVPGRLSADELADQIRKLGELRISGILTEEEFAQQKARLLART